MVAANFKEWWLILVVSLLPLLCWWLWVNFLREPWDPDCPLDVLIYFLFAIFLAPVIWLLSL